MEELGKISKNEDVSLETKARITNSHVLPITMYRYECWTEKVADKKKRIHLKYGFGGKVPETARKVNKWVL